MTSMNIVAEQKHLRQRLDDAYAEAAVPLSRDEVATIVHEVIATMQGDMSTEDVRLYKELEGLARYIQNARREIAAIRPDDIKDQHIPTATDELDAVVGATEKATFAIFDACDAIGGITGSLDGEAASKVMDQITLIYEACNFQDITGQRITKVVKTLKHIEGRVEQLLAAMDEERRDTVPVAAPPSVAVVETAPGGADPDKALLHGPQLPGNAIDQDEIDRLLASFD